MKHSLRFLAFSITLLGAISCNDGYDGPKPNPNPTTITFRATLNGANERPTPVTTDAMGTATVTFNNSTKMLTVSSGTYTGMTATASHIHGPATTEQTASPVITLTASNGTLTGSAALTTAQEADLKAELYYINVHSATYTGGEIRGQLLKYVGPGGGY